MIEHYHAGHPSAQVFAETTPREVIAGDRSEFDIPPSLLRGTAGPTPEPDPPRFAPVQANARARADTLKRAEAMLADPNLSDAVKARVRAALEAAEKEISA